MWKKKPAMSRGQSPKHQPSRKPAGIVKKVEMLFAHLKRILRLGQSMTMLKWVPEVF